VQIPSGETAGDKKLPAAVVVRDYLYGAIVAVLFALFLTTFVVRTFYIRHLDDSDAASSRRVLVTSSRIACAVLATERSRSSHRRSRRSRPNSSSA